MSSENNKKNKPYLIAYLHVLLFIIMVIYYIKDVNQVIHVSLDSTQQIFKSALIYITNFIVQKGVPLRTHQKQAKIPSIKVLNEFKDMS